MNAKQILDDVWLCGRTITQEECKFLEEQVVKQGMIITSLTTNLDMCLFLNNIIIQYYDELIPQIIESEFRKNGTTTLFRKWIRSKLYAERT